MDAVRLIGPCPTWALSAACSAGRQGIAGPAGGASARQVWLQLEAAAPATLRRARRLLKRAGDAPRLLDADTEAELDGAAPVLQACGRPRPSPAWGSPLSCVPTDVAAS